MGRQPRQRPISCHFCRVRKLRCSRQFPCSNCTTRGVTCQQQDPSQPSDLTGSNGFPAEASSNPNLPASEILARLDKLEEVVSSQAKELELARKRPYPGASSATPPASTTPLPPKLQRLTDDALRLERSSWMGHKVKVSQYLCFLDLSWRLLLTPCHVGVASV
jgi:hypothetical protein